MGEGFRSHINHTHLLNVRSQDFGRKYLCEEKMKLSKVEMWCGWVSWLCCSNVVVKISPGLCCLVDFCSFFVFQITKFAVWWCWAVLVWLQRVSLVRRSLEFFLIFEFCCSAVLGETQSDCAGCACAAVWWVWVNACVGSVWLGWVESIFPFFPKS